MFNQFNVEKKWYNYTDKIISVSGELFVENDVDISGDITCTNMISSGAFTDNFTITTDYTNPSSTKLKLTEFGEILIGSSQDAGTSGQVLQSNGSDSAVSWTTQIDTTYTAGSNMSLVGTEFNIPQSIATTANPTFNSVLTYGVFNSGGAVTIGPQLYAYPRFNIGGGNGANEAYLSNVMNSAYYFRIAGNPNYEGAMHFNANGYITGNPGFTNSSDDRLKHNETNITNALHLIRQLVPKKYQKTENMLPADYNGTLPEGMNYVNEAGFIAQDVKKITDLSFAVNGGDYEDEKEDGTKEIKAHPFSLNYDSIFTYVTAAVKELDNVVQQQEQLIKSLEARVKVLENN